MGADDMATPGVKVAAGMILVYFEGCTPDKAFYSYKYKVLIAVQYGSVVSTGQANHIYVTHRTLQKVHLLRWKESRLHLWNTTVHGCLSELNTL